MKWMKNFIDRHPKMKSSYEYEAAKWVQDEKNEQKKKIPEHRWWEVDDIDNIPLEVSDLYKSIFMRNIIDNEILDLLRNNKTNLKLLLDEIEEVALSLTQEERNETEILFLEGLINITLSEKTYEQFYSLLGPTLRKMCDSNNEFWVKLGEKNKNKQDEDYALLVENKKIEDEEKKDGNLYG